MTEAYRHCKAIAATGEGVELIAACPGIASSPADGEAADPALVVDDNGQIARVAREFIQAIAQHRNWTRLGKNRLVPSPAGKLRGEEAPL